ncbi:hypothetical protein EFZ62_06940 [Serratia marcescens]|nr:hypothetical protein EFZ62_06940 [Serratia marcescens]
MRKITLKTGLIKILSKTSGLLDELTSLILAGKLELLTVACLLVCLGPTITHLFGLLIHMSKF